MSIISLFIFISCLRTRYHTSEIKYTLHISIGSIICNFRVMEMCYTANVLCHRTCLQSGGVASISCVCCNRYVLLRSSRDFSFLKYFWMGFDSCIALLYFRQKFKTSRCMAMDEILYQIRNHHKLHINHNYEASLDDVGNICSQIHICCCPICYYGDNLFI